LFIFGFPFVKRRVAILSVIEASQNGNASLLENAGYNLKKEIRRLFIRNIYLNFVLVSIALIAGHTLNPSEAGIFGTKHQLGNLDLIEGTCAHDARLQVHVDDGLAHNLW